MSFHFIEREPETPLDELIQRQSMDNTRPARRPLMDDLRRLLNQRCSQCRAWLTDEARCLHCGAHQ